MVCSMFEPYYIPSTFHICHGQKLDSCPATCAWEWRKWRRLRHTWPASEVGLYTIGGLPLDR